MKIKRLAASVSACFEDFVTKVENHDAVAKIAIEDVQKAAAKIRSEKNKVDQRVKRLNEEKNHYEISIQRWKERAKSSVTQNEAKALECLKQIKVLETQLQHTALQHQEMQQLAHSLANNLIDVEKKLDELSSKRALLATRETRAKVNKAANQELGSLNVNEVFDRWELQIMENEYAQGSDAFNDNHRSADVELEKEFTSEEEAQVLHDELQALKAEMALENNIGGANHA